VRRWREPLARRAAAYHHPHRFDSTLQEAVMAKGQMRVPKEKKKPKAEKDKPKQMSAYKLSQQGGSASMGSTSPGKKG